MLEFERQRIVIALPLSLPDGHFVVNLSFAHDLTIAPHGDPFGPQASVLKRMISPMRALPFFFFYVSFRFIHPAISSCRDYPIYLWNAQPVLLLGLACGLYRFFPVDALSILKRNKLDYIEALESLESPFDAFVPRAII